MIRVESKSTADTEAVAAAVEPLLRSGDVILLGGELGAGKTVFTQGLAAAMGIDEAVTSPTFTLMRSYDSPSGRRLIHADLYRLENVQEVLDLGLAEMIEDASVTVVEWGEVATSVLPYDYLDVQIAFGATDDDRVLELTPTGSAWAARASALREAVTR